MPLKSAKPITPGRRGAVFQTNDDITERKPKKSLVKPLKRRAGRNSRGKITVRHRGGGHKRRLRIIDFKRDKPGVPGEVASDRVRPRTGRRGIAANKVPGRRLAVHNRPKRSRRRRPRSGGRWS